MIFAGTELSWSSPWLCPIEVSHFSLPFSTNVNWYSIWSLSSVANLKRTATWWESRGHVSRDFLQLCRLCSYWEWEKPDENMNTITYCCQENMPRSYVQRRSNKPSLNGGQHVLPASLLVWERQWVWGSMNWFSRQSLRAPQHFCAHADWFNRTWNLLAEGGCRHFFYLFYNTLQAILIMLRLQCSVVDQSQFSISKHVEHNISSHLYFMCSLWRYQDKALRDILSQTKKSRIYNWNFNLVREKDVSSQILLCKFWL